MDNAETSPLDHIQHNIRTIRNYVNTPALYEQMAEECSELAQVLLKKARKLRGENPTPRSLIEIDTDITEEFSDIILCAKVLCLDADNTIMSDKLHRWIDRIYNANIKKLDGSLSRRDDVPLNILSDLAETFLKTSSYIVKKACWRINVPGNDPIIIGYQKLHDTYWNSDLSSYEEIMGIGIFKEFDQEVPDIVVSEDQNVVYIFNKDVLKLASKVAGKPLIYVHILLNVYLDSSGRSNILKRLGIEE